MRKRLLFLLVALLLLMPISINALTLDDGTVVGSKYSTDLVTPFNSINEFGLSYGLEPNNNSTLQTGENHYITIKLHANGGYFNTLSETVKDSIQFRGDAFYEETIPNHINPNMIFVGWATSPDADAPDVQSGSTHTSMIGTDIYAVWADNCTVIYTAMGGYIDAAWQRMITNVYNKGDEIDYYIPTSDFGNIFEFKGWYKYVNQNASERVPEGYRIGNEYDLSLVSLWRFVPENMEALVLNQTYSTEETDLYYKFVPEETAVYQIFIDNLDYQDAPADIAILDSDNNRIKGTNTMSGNSVITYTMIAGETYYIEFVNVTSTIHEFEYGIKKNDNYRTVTFHANRDDQGDAYFDGDETKVTKQMPFSDGEEISHYINSGLELKNYRTMEFMGWSTDPNRTQMPLDPIEINSDIDVYAIIYDLDTITLDANGGFYPMLDGDTILEYDYKVGSVFLPPFDPHISDNTKKFAGWSSNRNATEPDADILEGVTTTDSLPKTLYAVYTDKILEIWDADAANGGYFLGDPSVTTYESTKGLGHIFYGLSLYNDDSRMVALGFKDQDGEIIPYTSEEYPFYHNKGDTTYKAIWGYKVAVDCNGGYFPLYDSTSMRLAMPVDEKFDLQYLYDNLGYPVMDGDENINKYVIGWATTPDAQEPDIEDGVTPISGLDRIYAVWGDDEYYFVEGEDSSWEQGSTKGLKFVIKRIGYDIDTYSAFTNLKIDGELVQSSNYKREEGSLILTLKPEYLNNLALGKHDILFTFAGDTQIATTFNIIKKSSTPDSGDKNSINPKTSDSIMLYVLLLLLSVVVIGTIFIKKKNKN